MLAAGRVDLSRSSKYGWVMASRAEILLGGLYVNIFYSREKTQGRKEDDINQDIFFVWNN